MVLYSLICWEMSGLSPQTASILKNEKLVPTAALTGSMGGGGGQDLILNHVVLGMALVSGFWESCLDPRLFGKSLPIQCHALVALTVTRTSCPKITQPFLVFHEIEV